MLSDDTVIRRTRRGVRAGVSTRRVLGLPAGWHEPQVAASGVRLALRLHVEMSAGQIDEGIDGLLRVGTGSMDSQHGALR